MEEQVFDQICINFWREELLGERLIRDKNLILRFGELTQGSYVLDLGSGTGRISNALGEEGIRVVGVERSEYALVKSQHNSNPNCTFIKSDWKNFAWNHSFNCVLFWFTTLCAGYNSDIESLQIAYSLLSKGGFLLIETRHWDRTNRRFDEKTEHHYGSDLLIEEHSYDPVTGIQTTQESFKIEEKIVRRQYQIRRYSFSELREMCLQIGFSTVEGFDEKGLVLSNKSERAILKAHKI